VSNTLTVGNIVTTNIYYGEDGTNRSIHLLPTSSNSSTIQGWISGTCNNYIKSFWTPTPVNYSNVVITSGASGYSGSVYLPSDKVIFVPSNTSNILVYSYAAEELFSNITGTGVAGGNFQGGVLLPTGNIIFVPQNSNVGMLNPLTYNFSNVITLPSGKYNGTLTSNGIVFTPKGTPSNIINYNFTTGTWANTVPFSQAPTSVYQIWQYASGQLTGSPWRSICWSPELMMFVAVATDNPGLGSSNRLAWSKDGVNWQNCVSYDTDLTLKSICWSPQLGMFVAVGSWFDNVSTFLYVGAALYSYDGLNWTTTYITTPTAPYGIYMSSVCWSPQLGMFVMTGDDDNYVTGRIYYSRNGISWTLANIPVGMTTILRAVGWSPKLGLFVVWGWAALGNPAYYSSDGINWTQCNISSVGVYIEGQVPKITWSQELGIFVVLSSSSFAPSVWSTDGINWYTGTCSGVPAQNPRIVDCDWSPQLGVFIAAAWRSYADPYGTTYQPATCAQMYSTDGKVWQPVTGPIGWAFPGDGSSPWTEWWGVSWSPELGRFAIVGFTYGASDYFMATHSLSTITLNYWRKATTDASSSIYRKSIYDSGAGKYIAVGAGGSGTYNATWSSDGINWNNPSSYSAVSGNQNTGLATGTSGGVNCTIAVGGQTGYAAAYTTDGGINWYGSDLNGFGVMGGTYWWGVATGGGVTWAVGEDWYSGSANQCSAYWSGPIYNYWIHPTGAFGYCNSLFDIDPYSRWDNIVYLAGSGIFLATASSNGGNTDCAYCPTSGPNQNSWQAMPSLGSLGGYGGPTLLAGDGYTACAISGGDVYWYTGGSWLYDFFSPFPFGTTKDLKSGSAMGGGWFILEYGGWVRRNPAGPFNGWPVYNSDLESNIVGYSWTTLAFGPTSTSTVVALRENNDVTVAAYYQTQTIPPYAPQCESSGAQLLPSGNVAFLSPGSSNIVQYNPVNLTISNTNVVSYSSTGMVLAPNGNVFCMPNLSNIKVYNPTSLTVSNIVTGTVNYRGGVLLPSGNLVAIPGSQSNIGMVNTTSLTFSNLTVFKSSNNMNFSGGTLIPSGKVIFCPSNVTNVGILDTFTPIASTFCLSPYFNKF
jgi:hypothetical protein